MTCTHYSSIKQNSFTALTILCDLPVYSPHPIPLPRFTEFYMYLSKNSLPDMQLQLFGVGLPWQSCPKPILESLLTVLKGADCAFGHLWGLLCFAQMHKVYVGVCGIKFCSFKTSEWGGCVHDPLVGHRPPSPITLDPRHLHREVGSPQTEPPLHSWGPGGRVCPRCLITVQTDLLAFREANVFCVQLSL